AVPSDVVGRLNKANSSGWRKTDEYVTHVTINSQNLRGHETTYAKPADTYRVIVLGDSFVFAVQVDEPDTLVSRLATSLQPPAPFTKIETINAGTDGWSTTNELAWLTTEGVHYEPDLVLLLFFVGNDPGENADRVDGWLTARQAPGPLRDLRMALAERSAFYSYLEYGVIANLSASQDTTHQPIDETHTDDARRQDPTRQDRGWAISGELLARMRALSIERQFDLVVVNVPTVELVSNPDWPERPLRGITDRLGIPMIDLLPVFRDEPRDRQRRLYFRGNKHWTPSGHELATRVVTEQLTQRGLRSPRTGSS
ncbi:MAG: alginate O-acetyltransferase AlgX-related protein, partial [Chloroflexota bacterium]